MSNFKFLHKEWPQIFEIAKEAEDMANIKARSSITCARSALEKGIRWMFENDDRLIMNTIVAELWVTFCFQMVLN